MTVRIGTVWDSTQQVLAGRVGMMAPFALIGFVLPGVLQKPKRTRRPNGSQPAHQR